MNVNDLCKALTNAELTHDVDETSQDGTYVEVEVEGGQVVFAFDGNTLTNIEVNCAEQE